MSDETAYPRWLQALLGPPGTLLAFLWGFAEGTLFFVVPDVCFTLTTGLRPRRGFLQLVAVIAGAFLAGNVMYSWAAAKPRQAQSVVAAVPFVGERMLEETYTRSETQGAWAMLQQPLGGVPFKVYAVLAPSHVPYAEFLLFSILARAERLLLTWVPAALIALFLRRLGAARRWHVALALHAVCWMAVYAYYWGSRL